MAGRRATQVGVGRERILRLCHANRKVAVAGIFPLLELVAHALVGDRLRAAIDALHDRVDLVEQPHLVRIERRELRGAAFGEFDHLVGEVLDACRALGPVTAHDRLGALCGHIRLHRLDFGVGVGDEVVDCYDGRHAELLHILDMAAEIGAALLHRFDVFRAEIVLLHPAIHLHGAHCRHDHGGGRLETGLAALDIEELFRAEIGAEACLGHHIVGELQCRGRRHDRVAAMRDVGERTAMHEGRIVLERLHQIGLHRVLQKHRHRAVALEVARIDRALVAPVSDDDVAEALLQILEISRQAQDRHHLRCDRDVEAGLAGIAVRNAAQRAHDLPQRTVVHVHHPPPGDPARVDAFGVAPVDVVVDQRRQQVVRRGDGVEVTGEVEVHVLHRHHLRHAAAGSTALDAEIGAERGLADAHDRLLADAVEAVAEADGRRRLALARRRRINCGDEDQLAVLAALLRRDELRRDLRLVVAVGKQVLGRYAELRANLLDRLLLCRACDLDVGFVLGHGFPLLGPRRAFDGHGRAHRSGIAPNAPS